MECNYVEVATNPVPKKSWKPFLRQLLISSCVWHQYFLTGLVFGGPTVFIPQLRREGNGTDTISDEMASWLSSTFYWSAIVCVFIILSLSHFIGRKKPFLLVGASTFTGFTIFYLAKTPNYIIISEIFLGVNIASSTTLSVIIIAEYTNPKYRGIFLTIKSATFFWGIWVSNAIGTYLHWSNIPLVGLILSGYSLLVFLWPESPYFLANVRKFDECRKSFLWLNGEDHFDLVNLIGQETKSGFSFKTAMKGEFYKPVLLSILLTLLYQLSGKLVCSMYAIEILKKITQSESTAYTSMLILDGVTVVGMYTGCGLSKILKRRVLLLVSASIGAFFIITLSAYLYFVKLGILTENNIVSVVLLTMFSISMSCGPMILSTAIYGELVPLKFKNVCMAIISLALMVQLSIFLKLSPLIFRTLGIHGTFLFFGVSASVCIIILYYLLPETKDLSLREIENYFNSKSDQISELVPKKYTSALQE